VTSWSSVASSPASWSRTTSRRPRADEVRALNDGGGEFFAARVPIHGKDRVARFYLGLRRKFQAPEARYARWWCNGSPVIVVEQEVTHPRLAPRLVTTVGLDAAGRVNAVYTFLATAKLTHVGRAAAARR
jgi:RNA polymerase sigma-70 factor (ECF subfamily)